MLDFTHSQIMTSEYKGHSRPESLFAILVFLVLINFILGSSMSLQVTVFCSFLWLNNIPFYT